ncbi:MAG: hypothetical protein J6N52_06395 [Clostridia bacterium]|nr:hypothetical protein [Clostridia bacterium]
MKQAMLFLISLCFLTGGSAYAGSIGKNIYCQGFGNRDIINNGSGRYVIEDISASSYLINPAWTDVSYKYGIMGKCSDDASLCFSYSRAGIVSTDPNNRPSWANSKLTTSFDDTEIKYGQKIHVSFELADYNRKTGFVFYLKGRTSEGAALQKYSYRQLYPSEHSASYAASAIAEKYNGWVYFVDMGNIHSINAKGNVWNKHDVVIDTCNEEYGGRQTIAFYYNGSLCTMGEFDADDSAEGIQYIKSVSGIEMVIQPNITTSDNVNYSVNEDSLYLDNIIVSAEDKDIELTVDGGAYTGAYSGNEAAFVGDLNDAMAIAAYGSGKGAEHFIFHPAELGDIGFEFPNTSRPSVFYLWNKDRLSPLTLPFEFVPFNSEAVLNEDFSQDTHSLDIRRGIAPVSAETVTGVFGKKASDGVLCVSNTGGSGVIGEISDLDAGVAVNAAASASGKDSVTLSFDYAQGGGSSVKNIAVNLPGGRMRELACIYPDGSIRVLGNICKDVVLNNNQWYHFEIIINSGFRGNLNTVTAYVNGRLCVKDAPFAVNNSIDKSFSGITGAEFSYNLASLGQEVNSEASFASDGFYLDNIRIELMNKSIPAVTEFDAESTNAFYNDATNTKSFTVEDYGQSAEDFISSLRGEIIKSAEFVTASGETVTSLPGNGEGYLRLTTADGYDIFYSLKPGENEEIRDNILSEINRNLDTTRWYPYIAPDINIISREGNILNARNFNAEEAGSRGFVQADGENFVLEDGTRISFWGCNIIGEGCFPEHEEAEKMADMIASFRFNLVRFHQLSGRGTTIFGGSGNAAALDNSQMEKLCYFLRELRERGIYYYIDLGRTLYDSDIDAETLPYNPTNANHVQYFDKAVQRLQIDYAKMLMTYIDPYTNRRICDNPALMGVQCVNESFLYGPALEEIGTGTEEYKYYYNMLNTQFTEWVKSNVNKSLLSLWLSGYISKDEYQTGIIRTGTYAERNSYKTQRNIDIIHFLTDLQSNYFADIRNMFKENNIRTLMSGATLFQVTEPPIVAANAEMDFLDTHDYWAHPQGYCIEEGLVLGDRFEKIASALKDSQLGMIGFLVNRKPYDKPYTISEWNHTAGSRYMAEGPLLMAAYSKMQNWNPMMFMFTGKGLESYENTRIYDVFNMSENPITLASLPAAAMLHENVSEAGECFYEDYSEHEPWDFSARGQWYNYDMFSWEPETGLLAKTGMSVMTKPENTASDIEAKKEAAAASGIYTSPAGDITYNKNNYSFTVNTGRSKAVGGFFGGGEITVGDASFTFDNEFAAAYVNSVTDSNISESGRILLTAVGKLANTGQVLSADGLKVIKPGTAPVLLEQITGTVKLKTAKCMNVYALDSSGVRKKKINAAWEGGILTIPLSLSDEASNYEITE